MASYHTSCIDFKQALHDTLTGVKYDVKAMLLQICNRHDMPAVIANRVTDYYRKCFEYNLSGGKLSRALTVCEALRFCMRDELKVDSDSFKAALVLGWSVEILQAFFLIEDDVMDRGIARRGRPCWYRNEDVGIANAINDGLLLEQVMYELIEANEYTKGIALSASRALRDASMRTVIGQHLDTYPPKSLLEFTRDQWLSVVRFKTAFYTFWLPCELGILVSGVKYSETEIKILKSVCLLLGELFQAQDDMLDCFGETSDIGKVGRDIEEGKCTWLLYTALESSDLGSRNEIVRLFSDAKISADPAIVQQVKSIYTSLNMKAKYEEFFDGMSEEIKGKISGLESEELQRLATWLFHSTCKKL